MTEDVKRKLQQMECFTCVESPDFICPIDECPHVDGKLALKLLKRLA